MGIKQKRLVLLARTLLTVILWVVVVVYAHNLAHVYEAELSEVLTSPYAKLSAVIAFLTALIYFICLSFPFLPNLGIRGVAMTFLWSSLIVFGHSVSHEGFHEIEASLVGMRDEFGIVGFLALTAVYALALAMPFVPGIEIGLLIIALLGVTGALIAYLATVGGLTLAFAIGRVTPDGKLKALMHRIGIKAKEGSIDSSFQQLLELNNGKSTLRHKLFAYILRYRHLTLGVAFNFPGNSVLGGGGGLAILSGMSKQFGWKGFLMTVAIATSPLPIMVLSGLIDTQPLLEHHGLLHNLLKNLEGLFKH
jgi:uncharacterized membrane protein YdjX (TVP38/TMEM64 family)